MIDMYNIINMIGDNITNVISFINNHSSPVNVAAVTFSLLFALAVLKSPNLQLFKVNYERQTMMAIPNIHLISENDRHTTERAVHNLFMNLKFGGECLLNRIVTMPENQRRNVIEYAQTFITTDIDVSNRIKVLEHLATTPNDQREKLMQLAQTFITTHMDSYDRLIVLEYLATTPKDQRKKLIQLAQTFITIDMNSYDRLIVLETIVKTPEDQREKLIQLAQTFIPIDMPPSIPLMNQSADSKT